MDRWYCARTLPKMEAFARVNLHRMGFATFFPRELRPMTYKGRHYEIPIPVFPIYLFVRFDRALERWRMINSTRGIKRLLPLHCELPIPIPDMAMEALQSRAVDEIMSLEATNEALAEIAPGEHAVVREGHWEGHSGVVLSNTKGRVEILMRLFNRQVAVPVPMAYVERDACA